VRKKRAPIREWFEVSRRPADVFAYLDDLSRHGEWQERVTEIRVEGSGPTTVGTRVVETRRFAGVPYRLAYEITEYTPPLGFSFRGVSGLVRPLGKRVIESLDDGSRARVTIEVDFEGRGAGKLVAPAVRKWAESEIRTNQLRLKELLENGDATRVRRPERATLVFDFDGTIVDSLAMLVAVFEEVTGRPRLTPAELRRLRTKTLRGVIRELRIRPWQIPSLARRMRQEAVSRIPTATIVDGMASTLTELHRLGYRMVVLSTNAPAAIESFLANNGIDGYFSAVQGDIGLRGKTAALKRIAKGERARASGCVYIGDEVRDVEAAERAGLPSIGVAWGFTDPDTLRRAGPRAFASTPSDLIQIADSIA
jgi:phosphoglycolate phosphatase-like HAD superfamily hydrolase